MTITIDITATGTADRDDRRAMAHVVSAANAQREENNQLPSSTAAEVRASYLVVQKEVLLRAHESYIKLAARADLNSRDIDNLWKSATDAQRDAARTALRS